MAAKRKIYDVRWEDFDGEQGYYVGMTKDEAEMVQRFLTSAHERGKISNPQVEALQGDRVLTKAQLLAQFKERYSG